MLQCTAVGNVPMPDGTVVHPLCELVERHDGEHAAHRWDMDPVGGSVWIRWRDDAARFVFVPWCDTEVDDKACHLFSGHPGAHSWDYYDPTWEVLRRIVTDGVNRRFRESD